MGAMLRISVKDTGPGIAPEKIHRLFEPFDRLDEEHKGEEGTGLGLTLSKGLVEAMHGTMGVESNRGQGSTFWVELPLIDMVIEAAVETHKTGASNKEKPANSGTVLYVEDNSANLRLIERIFKFRPGLKLLSTMLGRLGIDLAREHHPDAILLDLHLPDIQGDEVLRQLQDDPATRDIPVIVLSADATSHHVESLRANGARHYLVKPIHVQDLLDLLDETLSKGKR
jgi:CheY-like chemotaxis protein